VKCFLTNQRAELVVMLVSSIRYRSFFVKALYNVHFLVFCFQNFTLCAQLIVLQSSFIRIKKTIAEIFGLIKKKAKVFEFFCRILYLLNPGKITKKEANCIELESRITNICFSNIFGQ